MGLVGIGRLGGRDALAGWAFDAWARELEATRDGLVGRASTNVGLFTLRSCRNTHHPIIALWPISLFDLVLLFIPLTMKSIIGLRSCSGRHPHPHPLSLFMARSNFSSRAVVG
jgi:hypothetical protein